MVKVSDFVEVQGGPISLIFSNTGRAFFSERVTGNIWEIIGQEDYRLIKHLPIVEATGHHEAGVLGITLDPDFDKNGLMYAFFTEGKDLKHAKNKVIRFSVDSGGEEDLLSDLPGGRIHNGGTITIGPDNRLYVGIGIDNSVKEKSQDKDYLGGKILRINLDGSIPDDNPFEGSPVYSYGHRNVFGMMFNPTNGKLYVSDVGQDENDEIDIIESGGNYGWPIVSGFSNDSKFINPLIAYTPVITPTQVAFYKGNLYFGSYNEGNVHKLTLSNDGLKVISDTIVYQGKPFGIVGVFVDQDGDFFATTTNKIMKIKIGEANKVKNNIIYWVIGIIVIVLLGLGGYYIMNNSQYKASNTNTNETVATNTVNIQGSSFNPSSITVNVGDTVTWQNDDSAIHTVVADDNSFNLGEMASGGTVKHAFNTAGTFKYYCSIHTYMTGEVVVK